MIIFVFRHKKEIISKQKNINQHILYENLGLSLTDKNELKELILKKS